MIHLNFNMFPAAKLIFFCEIPKYIQAHNNILSCFMDKI